MCRISKSEVLRFLGHKGQKIPQDTANLTDELIFKAEKLLSPRYTHMICEPVFSDSGIRLKNTNLILTGNDILKHLKCAKECIVLACTLGAGFEAELLRLQAKSITEAVIFDAIGSAFIEAYADKIQEEILLPFKREGYFSNFRYSPGYGDLPLSLQSDVINALKCPQRIGLTVTETNIMIPRKSVTAFIGVFDSPQKEPGSKCEICPNRNTCNIGKR